MYSIRPSSMFNLKKINQISCWKIQSCHHVKLEGKSITKIVLALNSHPMCPYFSNALPLMRYPTNTYTHTHTHTHTYSDPTWVRFGPIEKAEWCPWVKSIDNRVHIRGMIPGSSHLQYILKALNTYCIIRIIYLTLNIKDMHAWCMAMATRSSRDTTTWHPLGTTHVLQWPRTDQSAKSDPSTNQSHRDSKSWRKSCEKICQTLRSKVAIDCNFGAQIRSQFE
jgi:hypothetical protein